MASPGTTNTPVTNPQLVFLQQEQAAGIPLISVGGDGPTDPNFKLTFAPSATPAQIAQANQDAQSFNWTPQPAPNYPGFFAACFADATLDLAHMEFVALLTQALSPIATFQALYTLGGTTFGASDAGMTTIANYAKTYNITT